MDTNWLDPFFEERGRSYACGREAGRDDILTQVASVLECSKEDVIKRFGIKLDFSAVAHV